MGPPGNRGNMLQAVLFTPGMETLIPINTMSGPALATAMPNDWGCANCYHFETFDFLNPSWSKVCNCCIMPKGPVHLGKRTGIPINRMPTRKK